MSRPTPKTCILCYVSYYLCKPLFFSIVPQGELYITSSTAKCMFVDSNIVVKNTCDNSKGYKWIYTASHRVINLNTLNCLTVGPENKAIVSPCKLTSKKQRWSTLRSQEDLTKLFLFNNETGTPMYINEYLTLTNYKYSNYFGFEKESPKERPRSVEYKGELLNIQLIQKRLSFKIS